MDIRTDTTTRPTPANDAEGETIQNQTAVPPMPSSLGEREHRSLLTRIFSIPEIGVLLPLLVLCGIITALNPTFYAPDNIINILRSMSYTGLIAVPMTYVFVAGGLDLSVGSVAGLAGVIAGLAMRGGLPIVVSVLLGLLVGVAAGLINGVLAVQLRIPAFIVTLGMLSVARGIIYILTQGDPVYPLPKAFSDFGDATWLRLPYSVLLLAVVSVLADFVLRKTTYGHAIYAVGGNEEVARLAGIPVKRIQISTYVLVAFASAASGILLAARLGSAAAAAGQLWEMTAISAVILGGTSMFGGVGTILGVMLGATIMAVLSNGMVLIGVIPYWQNVVLGVILVLAVGLDQLRRSRLAR